MVALLVASAQGPDFHSWEAALTEGVDIEAERREGREVDDDAEVLSSKIFEVAL